MRLLLTLAAALLAVTQSRCDVLARALSPGATEATLHLTMAAPDDVVLIGPQTAQVSVLPCTSGATQVKSRLELQVVLRPDAPGLHPLPVSGMAQLGEVQSEPAEFSVVAHYIAVAQIEVVEGKLQSCAGPCRIDYVLEVTNFGNAATTFSFEVVSQPDSGGWTARLPRISSWTRSVPAGRQCGRCSASTSPGARPSPVSR